MNTTPKEPTQRDYIEAHLLRYGTIEPLTALHEYGCYRLGAVIHTLRSEGMRIKTTTAEGVSRITGRPVHFAKYTLQ